MTRERAIELLYWLADEVADPELKQDILDFIDTIDDDVVIEPPIQQGVINDIAPKDLVWETPEAGFKIVGILGTEHGLFVTYYRTADRNIHGFESKIHLLNGGSAVEVYSGKQETIGQPFEHGGVVYFPNEHGSHILKYENGQIVNGAAHPRGVGKSWSVRGSVVNDTPVFFYNGSYKDRQFRDEPVVLDANTGQNYHKFNGVFAMPRAHEFFDGKHYVSVNFGKNGDRGIVIVGDGFKKNDALQLAQFRNKLYVGGGAKRSQKGTAADKNGKVYIWEDNQLKTVFDTGCTLINLMVAIDGNLYIIGDFPHRAFRIESDGKVYKIFDAQNGTPSGGLGSFSGSITKFDGSVYVAVSGPSGANHHAKVYRLG